MAIDERTREQKLWKAAASGDDATIRVLAMEGADFNARNEDGFTAFNLATMNGHAGTAMAIIAAKEMQYWRRLGAEREVIDLPQGVKKRRA